MKSATSFLSRKLPKGGTYAGGKFSPAYSHRRPRRRGALSGASQARVRTMISHCIMGLRNGDISLEGPHLPTGAGSAPSPARPHGCRHLLVRGRFEAVENGPRPSSLSNLSASVLSISRYCRVRAAYRNYTIKLG